MMRFTVTVVLALSLSASTLAQRSTEDDARKAVAELEHRWLRAENDPAALQSILAEDFVHVLPMGFITKDEQIGYLRSHPTKSQGEKHFENLRFRIYGDTAIATGVVVATGRDRKTELRTLFTDVFVRRDGKWQAVNAQELPEQKSKP